MVPTPISRIQELPWWVQAEVALTQGILGFQRYLPIDNVSRRACTLDYNLANLSYRYDVKDDGTWDNRVTFAHVSPGFPDGVHCDSKGNVYAGCGDGVQVWNPSGKLIGKIFLGETSANFRESRVGCQGELWGIPRWKRRDKGRTR